MEIKSEILKEAIKRAEQEKGKSCECCGWDYNDGGTYGDGYGDAGYGDAWE